MIAIRPSKDFVAWFRSLGDLRAKARISARIDRLSAGNPGDVRPVGDGVSELRIDVGPGYRVSFIGRGPSVIVLLGGGDKSSQERDIVWAKSIARSV